MEDKKDKKKKKPKKKVKKGDLTKPSRICILCTKVGDNGRNHSNKGCLYQQKVIRIESALHNIGLTPRHITFIYLNPDTNLEEEISGRIKYGGKFELDDPKGRELKDGKSIKRSPLARNLYELFKGDTSKEL